MKNRKQWYLLGVLLIVLAGIFINGLLETMEQKRNTRIQAAIVMKQGGEEEFSELMSGIRDYAGEKEILIHVNYMNDGQDLEKVLQEEQQLGSVGALILCPEDFGADSEKLKGLRNFPVLTVNRQQLPQEYRLEKEKLLSLMDGELEYLRVINEYQLGYSALDALILAEGKETPEEIYAEYLTLTLEEIDSGKYNALLSGR